MVGQPYELKPSFSAKRIYQWHMHWDGKIYVSFSGGLDSTVLAYIVCQAYREYHLSGSVYLVFSDTGTEFPEIREFVKEYTKWLGERFPDLEIIIDILYPQKDWNFKRVCKEKGFPIISKDTAGKIRKLRKGDLCKRYRNYLLNGDERGKFGMLAKKWQYLADDKKTQFDISEQCCDILKKEPFKRYVKETGRYPMIGITQDESFRRENQYSHTGCNVYDGTTIKSQPIAFWRKQDVLRFVTENSIPLCSVYGEIKQDCHGKHYLTGEQRTGCVLCGFGCHLEKEPNRIQRLAISDNPSHRAMYKWGMNLENNDIRYQDALQYCNIPTETWEQIGQMDFENFPELLPGQIEL